MKRISGLPRRSRPKHSNQHVKSHRKGNRRRIARPAVAHRQRGSDSGRRSEGFNAPETWHEPTAGKGIRYVQQKAGAGFFHPLTADDVRRRIAELPRRFTRGIEVVQFSRMTKKRALFPCYGMQWGPNIYLYPMEESLEETYLRPPHPEQRIEARMFGGRWEQRGNTWKLVWTPEAVRDFYLNNVLIHEIGHINDDRNSNSEDRERYANWFAVEYGYRASRGRR